MFLCQCALKDGEKIVGGTFFEEGGLLFIPERNQGWKQSKVNSVALERWSFISGTKGERGKQGAARFHCQRFNTNSRNKRN